MRRRREESAATTAAVQRRVYAQFYRLFERLLKSEPPQISKLESEQPQLQKAPLERLHEKLGVATTAEISLVLNGRRPPSPEFVVRMISSLLKGHNDHGSHIGVETNDCWQELDQASIYAGLAPFGNRHLQWRNEFIRKNDQDDHWVLEREDQPLRLPDEVALLCMHDDMLLVHLPSTRKPTSEHSFVLLAPETRDLMSDASSSVGRSKSRRSQIRTLSSAGPTPSVIRVTRPGCDTAETMRVVVRIDVPKSPPAIRRKPLQRLVISVSPFQDAALAAVGQSLGWWEEVGLLCELRSDRWYETDFRLGAASRDCHCLYFRNIFSFADACRREDPNAKGAVFLYPVNEFRGYALLGANSPGGHGPVGLRDDGATDADAVAILTRIANGKKSEVATMVHSDSGSQVYRMAKRLGLRLNVQGKTEPILSGPGQGITLVDRESKAGLVAITSLLEFKYCVGTVPHRVRLKHDHRWREWISDLGSPYPINGFVGSRSLMTDPSGIDVLQRFFSVWFRIAALVNGEKQDYSFEQTPRGAMSEANSKYNRLDRPSRIIERALPALGRGSLGKGAGVPLKVTSSRNEIVEAWQEEKFFPSAKDVGDNLLKSTDGNLSAWESDLKESVEYLDKIDIEHKKSDIVLGDRFPIAQVHKLLMSGND